MNNRLIINIKNVTDCKAGNILHYEKRFQSITTFT